MIITIKNYIKSITTRHGFESALIALLFFALPLATSPWFLPNPLMVKWKIIHIFSLFTLFQLLFAHKKLTLPSFGKPATYALLGIFLLWGWHYFFHRIPLMSYVTVERLSFFILTVFFYQIFNNRPHILTLIGHSLMAAMLVLVTWAFTTKSLVFSDFGFPIAPVGRKFGLTFGNQNMAAVFYGFVVLFSLRHRINYAGKKGRYIYGAIGLMAAIFLLQTGCRSALMGGFLASTHYGFMRMKKQRMGLFFALIGALGIFINPHFLSKHKIKTTQHRMEIAQNALQMAKDYPLGVGRGKFNFYHTLYQKETHVSPRAEHLVERTPHSEPLKYLAEEGVLFIGLILLFLAFFLKRHGKEIFEVLKHKESLQISTAFLLFLGIEFAIQFPMEVAFSYLMITCILGHLLTHIKGTVTTKPWTSVTWISVKGLVFAGYGAAIGILAMASLAYGLKRDDLAFTQRACKLAPYAWRACNAHMHNLSRHQHSKAMLRYALQELKVRPYHMGNILIASRALAQMKRFKTACQFMYFYDRVFYHESSVHDLVMKLCPAEHVKADLQLPLKEHYKSLFQSLPPHHKQKLFHNL